MKNTIIFDNKIDFKQGETLTFFLNENFDFRAESRIFSAQTLNKIQVYLKNLKFKKIKEKIIGWFQGRMEFGPRALGARSIIADPRSETMQKKLNLKVKFRESFRPFAPSVIREDLSDWFDLDCDSPYMLLVADVRNNIKKEMTEEEKKLFGIEKLNVKRSDIPAVTHVDYSARIQTVHENTNPRYYKLIKNFKN